MADIKTHQNDLNEKFFKDMDDRLIEQLRTQQQQAEQTEALAQASGIEDPNLLAELVGSGVTTETLSAFRMVPLVAVAWSDGTVQDEERAAILQAASDKGLGEGTASRELLMTWLERKIPEDLITAWKEYAGSLSDSLSAAAVATLRAETVDQAEQIATAAGGILGLGSISGSEAKVIRDLKSAFGQ